LTFFKISLCSAPVDLRGQFSNHVTRKIVDLAETAMALLSKGDSSVHAARSGPRQPQIKDRVDARQAAHRFVCGTTIRELATEYKVSESSMKRLLRAYRLAAS